MITPVQCRMARAALGWGVRDVAAASRVNVTTVTRFENRMGKAIPATVEAIQRALEAAGAEFKPDGVTVRAPVMDAA